MKKSLALLISILLFCFSQAWGQGTTIIQGQTLSGSKKTVLVDSDGALVTSTSPYSGSAVLTTTGALTFYVRSDGADTHACDVDSAAGACLTIQGTLAKVPRMILHAVTINVGAGNFAGFNLSGFIVPRMVGTFTISGTLGDPTLTGGTISGTATGGSVSQCADTGQHWVVDELRGRLVSSGGQYRVIRNNTGTAMNLIGDLSVSCSGTAYHIYEQGLSSA